MAAAGVSAQDLGLSVTASAPSTSINDMSQRGLHFQALTQYYQTTEQDPSLIGRSDKLAAAQSAWALGLAKQAREIWQAVISDKGFSGIERERVILALSILELQEENVDLASRYAQEAASRLESSPLRAQFWLVIAQALTKKALDAQAQGYYKRAAEEAGVDHKSETLFLLGENQLRQGQLTDARYSFVAVSTPSDFAGKSLRRLIELDLKQNEHESVLTWIREGRSLYHQEFDDPWISYAFITAQLALGRKDDAQEEIKFARSRFANNNSWLHLASAAIEADLFNSNPVSQEIKLHRTRLKDSSNDSLNAGGSR